MQSILSSDRFVKIEPIKRGWSNEDKYSMIDKSGTQYFLKVFSTSQYEKCKTLFDMLEQLKELDIPMCAPIEFDTCAEGVYMLYNWVDGKDLGQALPVLPKDEQYTLGLAAGRALKKIHTLPAPATQEDWAARFNRKTENKIKVYHECGLKFEGDTHVLEFLRNNQHLLDNRPQCFNHGDYHVGNMMYHKDTLVIIDFDRYDFGDPWEEFNRIVWCAEASPHFASGRLHGYFDGEPPLEFFGLMAFYIVSNTLSSLPWSIPFGQVEIDTAMNQAKQVLKWFDNMRSPVPSWYIKLH